MSNKKRVIAIIIIVIIGIALFSTLTLLGLKLIFGPDNVSDVGIFIIRRNSDFQEYGFQGSGTEEDPYLIENYTLENDSICLSICNTKAYFVVRNCTFTGQNVLAEIVNIKANTAIIENNTFICNGAYIGFYHSSTENTIFRNNIFINLISPPESTFTGIEFYKSSNCMIKNNSFTNFNNGMRFFITDSMMVQDNHFGSNYNGVDFFDSTNCYITSNYFVNNTRGLYINTGESMYISENYFLNNSNGIVTQQANLLSIYMNVLKNNSLYGIELHFTSKAVIYNNNFINNNLLDSSGNFTQAYDASNGERPNKWYNSTTLTGNYWSDLSWVVGSQYLIAGGLNYDLYPLENPIVIDA